MDEIRDQLVEVFPGQVEDLLRVLYYLDEEQRVFPENAAAALKLKSVRSNAAVFRQYAQKLADDTKELYRNPKFLQMMAELYGKMMEPTVASYDTNKDQVRHWHSPGVVHLFYRSDVLLVAHTSITNYCIL